MNDIITSWNRSTVNRMKKGGDLYRRPMTRAEMVAPLKWHEEQMARVHRYGELADGSVGWEVLK